MRGDDGKSAESLSGDSVVRDPGKSVTPGMLDDGANDG